MEFYYSDHTYDSTEKVLWIKDGVKTISLDMFSRFHNPAYDTLYKEENFKVIIPNSVEKIETRGFYGMSASEYQIPNSVKEIGSDAFEHNDCLKSIQWPSSVKVISERVFYWCTSLEKVVLPEGIEEIGFFAFSGCRKLSEIVIPTTVQRLGGEIFDACDKLKEIYVPKALYDNYYYEYGKSFFICDTYAEVIPYNEPMGKNAITDLKAGKENTEIVSNFPKEFKSFCGTIRTNLIADKRKK